MNDPSEKVKKLEDEIKRNQDKLTKMKKYFPFLIVIGIIFSFLYPYIPGRRGKESLAVRYGYEYSVMFSAAIFIILVPLFYYLTKKDLKRKIENKSKEIKSLKYRMENEPNTL